MQVHKYRQKNLILEIIYETKNRKYLTIPRKLLVVVLHKKKILLGSLFPGKNATKMLE